MAQLNNLRKLVFALERLFLAYQKMSPDLLLSADYINVMVTVKNERIVTAAGKDLGMLWLIPQALLFNSYLSTFYQTAKCKNWNMNMLDPYSTKISRFMNYSKDLCVFVFTI